MSTGIRISNVATHSFGVTLWLVPPRISVRVAVSIIPLFLSSWPLSNSFFNSVMTDDVSSMEFFASHGALA